jgi:hypothetical protein
MGAANPLHGVTSARISRAARLAAGATLNRGPVSSLIADDFLVSRIKS